MSSGCYTGGYSIVRDHNTVVNASSPDINKTYAALLKSLPLDLQEMCTDAVKCYTLLCDKRRDTPAVYVECSRSLCAVSLRC